MNRASTYVNLKLRVFTISFFSVNPCEVGNMAGLYFLPGLFASLRVNKIAEQNEKKAQKERMNFSKKVCFFVKIRKKHTQMRSLLWVLLCSKPISGSKTGVKLGLIGFVLQPDKGAFFVYNALL